MPGGQWDPWKVEQEDHPFQDENSPSKLIQMKHTHSNHYIDMIARDETDEGMVFEGTSPLQIPFPSTSGPTSVPYSTNLDMSMNNDLVDLSKPLKGYPLRKGISNISLDSLNDNYIESSDTLRNSSRENSSAEGSLENLLELSREIQDYGSEEFSDFERWNNFVNLTKSQRPANYRGGSSSSQDEDTNYVDESDEESGAITPRGDFPQRESLPPNPNFHLPLKSKSISAQIHNQLYGPVINSAPAGENASSNSTMSIATTGSLRSDITASPESYDMLYRSFEIAAMIDHEDRKHGKTLTPSVPNIEMLSPKLQRLRQVSTECSSSPQPNFCAFGESAKKAEWGVKQDTESSESRKVTFADLAQQKKKHEQEKEDVRPMSLPVVTETRQHWTELLSSTKTPDFVKQVKQQTDGLSPRRPQSLPLGLRHVKKPASRPFPKDVTPESFNSFRQEEPTECLAPELGVVRTFSAPEGFERAEEILVEEKCYDSVDNLAFPKSSDVSRALTEACIANNNGFMGKGVIVKHMVTKIPPLGFSTISSKPRIPESYVAFPSTSREAGFQDSYTNMQSYHSHTSQPCDESVTCDDDDEEDDNDGYYYNDDDGYYYDDDNYYYNDYDDDNDNYDDNYFQVDKSTEVTDADIFRPVNLRLMRYDSLEGTPCDTVAVATQTESITTEEGTQTIHKSVRIASPNSSDLKRTLSNEQNIKSDKIATKYSKVSKRDIRRQKYTGETNQKLDVVETSCVRSGRIKADRATVYSTADAICPVKVKQSQRHKVLRQDLLGEVVYVQNKPLKPIYQVDAEHNIRKGLPFLPGPSLAPLHLSQPILPAVESQPPSIDFRDQPSFFGCEDAPVDIPLSAYEEMENSVEVDVTQKKGLVSAVNAATDLILEHFGKSRHVCGKIRLGDSDYTPDIGHMVLRYLCPALAAILSDGMHPYVRNVIVGRMKTSVWNAVQATTQLGPATKQMHEILSHVSSQSFLTDPVMKFNAFIFGLLNSKCLELWLQHVTSRTDTLEKLYKDDSFLRLVDDVLKPLFEELLVAIQPLCELPFKLDCKFEHNHIQEMKAREQGKQRLQAEHEKKNHFSPFQLMKKVTQKTYEKVSNHSHGRCKEDSKFEDDDEEDSGKGWSVNWMKGLISSGSKQEKKESGKLAEIKSRSKTPPRRLELNQTPGSKSQVGFTAEQPKSQRWSLFGSSISKALDNMIVDGGNSLLQGRLNPADPFRFRRRGVSSETEIPADVADELMGPRPDPTGASDSNASSPEWNLSAMQCEAKTRHRKTSTKICS